MKKAFAIVIVVLLALGMVAMFSASFLGGSQVPAPTTTTAQ